MAKKASISLPFLLLLIAVGAGVVFLGSSLTGLQIYQVNSNVLSQTVLNSPMTVSNVSYLYPMNVGSSSGVINASYAVYDTDSRSAVFVETNSTTICPDTAWVHSNELGWNRCNFDRAGIGSWLRTTNRFRTSSGSFFVNPTNITAIEINARVWNRSIEYEYYRVYVKQRCITSTSYSWEYLGSCPLERRSLTCAQNLSTVDCPSGKWQISSIVVGQRSSGALDMSLRWIRAIQAR
ncbi:MAG: hypothetical protein Q8R15_01535 [Candidatus Micrarchaeota archaeon]|nr:hypothetical protein [Candidatus Micrarchaeota archaeon]